MRDYHLTAHDPYTLRLAADARLGPTDYADDHIWELTLSGGEPPALAARTTYGMRAREMRLFPTFAENGRTVIDPADFAVAPTIRASFVNYHRLSYWPLPQLSVVAHYWVASSHALACELTLTNHAPEPRTIGLGLAALLKPLENARNLSALQREGQVWLEGQSGNLAILALLDGATEVEPTHYPAIARALMFEPGGMANVRWVCAARPTSEAALQLAQALLTREWDGEFARLELINAGLLDIETGNADWDAALAFAQQVALRGYVGPTPHLPQPSFVLTRHPDRGYSRTGDGADYNWQWDGQAASAAYVNVPQILPAAPDLAKGLVRNWLAVQDVSGFIDWKPGLGGQRNKALCMPLLSSITEHIYAHTEDLAFIAEVYPALRRFFEAWFTHRHDRDGDGVPEWSHTLQSAYDDRPAFVPWQAWAQSADIACAESPDLAAYLYREGRSLQAMAARLGLPAEAELEQRLARLHQAVEAMWCDETASYHTVDRDGHTITHGEILFTGQGNLSAEVHRRFEPSARLVVKISGPKDERPLIEITFSGRGKRGRHRVETLRRSHVQWYFGLGAATSEKLYAELERIEITGLTEAHTVTVSVVDYTRQDQTLLAPLWAGIPNVARAEALVRRTITDPARYWRAYGLPSCAAHDPAYKADNREGSGGVGLLWNTLVGEGLLAYGYRAEAGELVTRLMTGIVHSLKTEKAFREAYNPDELEGLGDRDYLWGVAPIALFMETLGVRFISPRRVWLAGHNPFPWPVTVRWKGVTVTKNAEGAVVTFPSGAQQVVTDPAAQFVEEKD